jgi:hypothetical protein
VAGSPGTGRPVPVPDELSAPYWEAAARHVLVIARCSRCGAFAIPPGQVCPACGTTDPSHVWTEVSGTGTVRSWTIIRQSFLPGFDDDLPYLLADVELTGLELNGQAGLRMIGRLLDGPNSAVGAGTPVRVAFEDVASGVSVPAFRLSGNTV